VTFDDLRSEGTTASERLLHRLCSGTFLTLWSYSNLFRDQGQRGKGTDGKELCDLLVVCGDDVIILSDKACAYPTNTSPKVAWSRWYRRAIEKSTAQVLGAERWIRTYPNRVYLDKGCTVALPIPLSESPRFHRIVVATGARDACQQVHGEPGSLALQPRLVGAHHLADDATPFEVGFPDEARRPVHVLDDVTAPALLRQLDTIQDFIRYLREKKALLDRGGLVYAQNELSLLAAYLSSVGPDEHHAFPQDALLLASGGLWNELQSLPNVRRKALADHESYLWDRLIEYFSSLLRREQLVGPDANDVVNTEQLLRRMALTHRVERRHLARAIIEIREGASSHRKDFAVRTIAIDRRSPSDVFFVMALQNQEEDYEKYRRNRRTLLEAYAWVTKRRFPSSKHVIGVAFEPQGSDGGSEDAFLFAPLTWTEEDNERALLMTRRLGLPEIPDSHPIQDWEFPPFVAKSTDQRRRERNQRKRRGQDRK